QDVAGNFRSVGQGGSSGEKLPAPPLRHAVLTCRIGSGAFARNEPDPRYRTIASRLLLRVSLAPARGQGGRANDVHISPYCLDFVAFVKKLFISVEYAPLFCSAATMILGIAKFFSFRT